MIFLAQAYDDATFKAIEKYGGGVTTDIMEALQQIAVSSDRDSSIVRVADGYQWLLVEKLSSDTGIDEFSSLAAKVLVRELSKQIVDDNLT